MKTSRTYFLLLLSFFTLTQVFESTPSAAPKNTKSTSKKQLKRPRVAQEDEDDNQDESCKDQKKETHIASASAHMNVDEDNECAVIMAQFAASNQQSNSEAAAALQSLQDFEFDQCVDNDAPLSQWKELCEQREVMEKKFKDLHNKMPLLPSAISYQAFMQLIEQHNNLMKTVLAQEDKQVKSYGYPETKHKLFLQKNIVPEHALVAMWGDLHGSIFSLLRSLDQLKKEGIINDDFIIIKPNFYLFFLGDFVDRGNYGIEVITTLLRLKIANPEKVYLFRGNHEDYNLNLVGGFFSELNKKFKNKSTKNYKEIFELYDYLPVATFLGFGQNAKQFTLCCHGGIEPGFNPHDLLHSSGDMQFAYLTTLKRTAWFNNLSQEMKKIVLQKLPGFELEDFVCEGSMQQAKNDPGIISLGFLWHDFNDDKNFVIDYSSRPVWVWGHELVQQYLNVQESGQNSTQEHNAASSSAAAAASSGMPVSNESHNNIAKVATIIRAHQHSNEYALMLSRLIAQKGVVKLWDGMVYTLLSAPTVDQAFTYDSFVIVAKGAQDQIILTHKFYPIS